MLFDRRQVHRRHREGDVDRFELGDCHELLVDGGEIADLHGVVAGAAVDRRSDIRVAQLHPGVFRDRLLDGQLRSGARDCRLVRVHGRERGVGLGVRLLAGVLGHDAFGDELPLSLSCELLEFRGRGVAGELRFRLREQRLIAGFVGLRLLQRRCERARIDFEERSALLDDVSFMKKRLFDLTSDLRAD